MNSLYIKIENRNICCTIQNNLINLQMKPALQKPGLGLCGRVDSYCGALRSAKT